MITWFRVRVANELGAGNGKGARFATIVSVTTSAVIGVFFWILIMLFHNELALIFTTSEPVLHAVSKLSVLLAFTILLNSIQPVLSGEPILVLNLYYLRTTTFIESINGDNMFPILIISNRYILNPFDLIYRCCGWLRMAGICSIHKLRLLLLDRCPHGSCHGVVFPSWRHGMYTFNIFFYLGYLYYIWLYWTNFFFLAIFNNEDEKGIMSLS